MASEPEQLVVLDHHGVPDDVDAAAETRIPILDEEEIVECRICREEEQELQLEAPCACSGSVKFVHRECVQRWCNIKGNTVCEICKQDFKGGYTVISLHTDNEELGFGRDTNPREGLASHLLQGSAVDEHYFRRIRTKSGLVFCCGSASLVLVALVFLQHFVSIVEEMGGDDSPLLLVIHLLTALGFLLLCYITVGAIRVLHRTSPHSVAGELRLWSLPPFSLSDKFLVTVIFQDPEEVVGRREVVVYLAFFASSFTFFFSQCFV
ncbi:hypothetical protein ACLOJK_028054 [Asimina triloba]